MKIPQTGRPPDDVLGELRARQAADVDWRRGRVFSLVYHAGDAHEQLVKAAHAQYGSANLLNPMAFPSLKQLEKELVEMAGTLMHGTGVVGTVTSGGTESILCAVAAYRDRAHKWWPELVVPRTIHPAFDKAAHYFGVRLVKVDVRDDMRVDARAMEKKISRRTIGLVASAPQYPHGVVDPIAELGEIAQRHGLPLHVDACVGGFVLPWLEKLGRPMPAWDFRVPGVTSISADLHKFGYAGKGASLLLWRSLADLERQIFIATDFPGGIYASPTLLGTRPGGPIAAAWAAMQSQGEAGYLALAKTAADAADRLRTGIRGLGLHVLPSDSTIVAWGQTQVAQVPRTRIGRAVRAQLVQLVSDPLFAVADRLEARGWSVDRMHRPEAIHLTVTANHAPVVDEYLADLAAALAEVRADPSLAKQGTAPMYGMAGKLPVRRLVARNVRKMIAEMYAP